MITETEQALQSILKPGERADHQQLTDAGFYRQTYTGLFSSSFCWNCQRQTEDLITPTGRKCCANCGVEK